MKVAVLFIKVNGGGIFCMTIGKKRLANVYILRNLNQKISILILTYKNNNNYSENFMSQNFPVCAYYISHYNIIVERQINMSVGTLG